VRPTTAGTLTMTVRVTASEPDPDPDNNMATRVTTVQPSPPTGTGGETGGGQSPGTIGPFDEAVAAFSDIPLRNGFARRLAGRMALSRLFTFVGKRSGDRGYLRFLDTNRDGVIARREVVPLVRAWREFK
jgi:hypothetical protein